MLRSDVFVVKYDTSGTRLSTNQRGSTEDDNNYGAAVDAAGNLYVVGETAGSVDSRTNAGSFDLLLVKYDASGNWVWTRQYGSTTDDVALGIAVHVAGTIFVAGETGGGLDGNTNVGGNDLFVLKFDLLGVLQ